MLDDLKYIEFLTCETKHCNNTGVYEYNGEWLCFECLSQTDKYKYLTDIYKKSKK